MSILDTYCRVSKRTPCPVCDKPDWCLVSRDDPPSRAICKRIESARRFADAGYLHELAPSTFRSKPSRCSWTAVIRTPVSSFAAVLPPARADVSRDQLGPLAMHLGVSTQSLRRLGGGWLSAEEIRSLGTKARTGAWYFVMFNGRGEPIGARLRNTKGKFALKHSRNGIFIPSGQSEPLDTLLITEGESDAAAMLDLGFFAIGKPGAGSADLHVAICARRMNPARIVIVADNDEIGHASAHALAGRLAADHRDVRVIQPSGAVKDARAWMLAGADRSVVIEAIDAATPMKLVTRVHERRL